LVPLQVDNDPKKAPTVLFLGVFSLSTAI